jgi:hypothetical protein
MVTFQDILIWKVICCSCCCFGRYWPVPGGMRHLPEGCQWQFPPIFRKWKWKNSTLKNKPLPGFRKSRLCFPFWIQILLEWGNKGFLEGQIKTQVGVVGSWVVACGKSIPGEGTRSPWPGSKGDVTVPRFFWEGAWESAPRKSSRWNTYQHAYIKTSSKHHLGQDL